MFDARSAIVLSLIAVGAVACSSLSEEAVLEQFFAAARLRDKTALASVATVAFEPHIDGIVTEFDVTDVTAERWTPFTRPPVGQAGYDQGADGLIVSLSIDTRPDVDIRKYDGRIGSKGLTVEARVTLPDGGIVQRTLIVTIQRAVLKANPEIVGRWIITGIRNANR